MSNNNWKSENHFRNTVVQIANQLDIDLGTIFVIQMKNKWASITSDGKRLYFNKELLDLSIPLGKYVITHELIHLLVPNHGKLFKSYMRIYLKDEKELKDRLRKLRIDD